MEFKDNPIHENASIDVPQYLPHKQPQHVVNHYHIQNIQSKLALATGFLLGFIGGYFLKAMLP